MTVSLVEIITSHHYRSNNYKVIHNIHTTQIKEGSYIGSWITTEFNNNEVFGFENTAGALIPTRRYKGQHRALRCEVYGGSSNLWLPVDFPSLQRIAIEPHELPITTAILRYLFEHLICKKNLSN
jgi:hypothetical protein